MRIAFAGTPDVALPSLQALVEAGHEVVAVITRPDAAAGRGRALQSSPVAVYAEERGLPVWKPAQVADIAAQLEALALDCVAVVAYGGIVPERLLAMPRHGWINLHFSLLPSWRGAAPVQHAIIAGDDITGACTFQLERGLDTGPVFGCITRAIEPTDTAGSLLDALAIDGAQLLTQTLASLGQLAPVPQEGAPSLAPKLSKDDARVVWHHPALAVDRGIRGCTPDPGAWSETGAQRLGLEPVTLRPDVQDLQPGAVQVVDRVVLVGTGSHAVQLGRVKPAGKAWMDAESWMRGQREAVEFTDAR